LPAITRPGIEAMLEPTPDYFRNDARASELGTAVRQISPANIVLGFLVLNDDNCYRRAPKSQRAGQV
jgi:hypothetical protein